MQAQAPRPSPAIQPDTVSAQGTGANNISTLHVAPPARQLPARGEPAPASAALSDTLIRQWRRSIYARDLWAVPTGAAATAIAAARAAAATAAAGGGGGSGGGGARSMADLTAGSTTPSCSPAVVGSSTGSGRQQRGGSRGVKTPLHPSRAQVTPSLKHVETWVTRELQALLMEEVSEHGLCAAKQANDQLGNRAHDQLRKPCVGAC